MNELSVDKIVGNAWNYSKNNIVIALIILVISIIQSTITGSDIVPSLRDLAMTNNTEALNVLSEKLDSNFRPTKIIATCVQMLLMIGLTRCLLLITTGKTDRFSLNGYNMPAATYLKAFVCEFMVRIIEGLSFACCIVPFFFVAPRITFASLYIIEGKTDNPFKAISMCYDDTNGETGSLLLLGLISILIEGLGFLCCCIGFYFAAVIANFMFVLTYMAFTPREDDNVTLNDLGSRE